MSTQNGEFLDAYATQTAFRFAAQVLDSVTTNKYQQQISVDTYGTVCGELKIDMAYAMEIDHLPAIQIIAIVDQQLLGLSVHRVQFDRILDGENAAAAIDVDFLYDLANIVCTPCVRVRNNVERSTDPEQ